MKIQKESSGGILYCFDGKNFLFFFAHHQEHGYVIPKGGKKENEEIEDTAVREIREETGYVVNKQNLYLGNIKYEFEKEGKEYEKIVHFFGFKIEDKNNKLPLALEENEKIEEGKWFTCEEALNTITFENEKEIIIKLNSLIKK